MNSNQYRLTFTLIFILGLIFSSIGQQEMNHIHKLITHKKVYTDMMFIASDELKGRKTGEPGNQVAAGYIADQLKLAGVQTLPGMKDYFQVIPFVRFTPPKEGSLSINGISFEVNTTMVIVGGGETEAGHIEAIYADFGWIDTTPGLDDYRDLDVKGKYVIVQAGPPSGGSPSQVAASILKKRMMAVSRGALGLIEWCGPNFNWTFFRNYFSKERLVISETGSDATNIFHAFIQEPSANTGLNFIKGKSYILTLKTPGAKNAPVNAVNVIGVIPGRKKEWRDQYLMLTAHFDHIGVNAGQRVGNDSIWNGARDNAWGTVCLIEAARYFSRYPADRSVLIAAVNAEEMGLLGSKYLSEHPVVPWNKVIFDLNTDGAGYSDTTIVSIIGLNRVGAATELNAGCNAFGLKTYADPAPEQGLFDRSDNVNFAKLGIPAPNFGSGFTSFDAAVRKYYHQSIDNPDNISYGYLLRFCKSFTLSAAQIANKKELPRWTPGDKYEAAGKKLYGY